MKNCFIQDNLKLKNHIALKLPDFDIFEESEKTLENFKKMTKGDYTGIKYFYKFFDNTLTRNTTDKANELYSYNYRYPIIHLVTNNSVIIETKDKMFLVNFEINKITILFNKINNSEIKIIYTYDEYVFLYKLQKKFIRTYIFCLDKRRKLHYFYLEDNYLNLKYQKIILHKITYAGDDVIDMCLKCLTHTSENGKFYFLIFLTKTNIKFFITDYYENDLGLILNSLDIKKENIYKKLEIEGSYDNLESYKEDLFKKRNSVFDLISSKLKNDKSANQNELTNSYLSNLSNDNSSLEKRLSSLNESILKSRRLNNLFTSFDFKKIELYFNSEEEYFRIFLNEDNKTFSLSFLSFFNLLSIKLDCNISPNILEEKLNFSRFTRGPLHVIKKISTVLDFKKKKDIKYEKNNFTKNDKYKLQEREDDLESKNYSLKKTFI